MKSLLEYRINKSVSSSFYDARVLSLSATDSQMTKRFIKTSLLRTRFSGNENIAM